MNPNEECVVKSNLSAHDNQSFTQRQPTNIWSHGQRIKGGRRKNSAERYTIRSRSNMRAVYAGLVGHQKERARNFKSFEFSRQRYNRNDTIFTPD